MGRRQTAKWFLLAGLAIAGCSGGPKDGKEAAEKDYLDRVNSRLNAAPPPVPPGPKASEFKTYQSPDGLFRVNFPGQPEVLNSGASVPEKRLEDKWYRVELKPRSYSVRYYHYESDPDPAVELPKQVDLQVGRTLEGKVTETKDVPFKGHPGKEVVIVDDDKARRLKLIVVGKDVYQVFVDLPVAEINGDEAKAFIESFALLKD